VQEGSQFGAYQLIKRVAYGGMAEIHLAKTQGLRGFERLLALKVIHPKYSEDQEFIDMLVDEAKLAVQLSHGNICQTFDLGRIDSTYYIAMEFIDGKDLYQLLVKCSELDILIPFDIIAFIALSTAAGLQYAHTRSDNYGRQLDLIHRDISPQNVIVSYDGEVKIVDFGIAKASQRGKETESGVIKGKFFYMSPEQAWGENIDHRTDIFSAGICLYEMITGEMLYNEEKALVLLDKVRKAEVPDMRALRPDVPPELERIAREALRRDRDERYESAGALQGALSGFLYKNWPKFNRRRVADFMKHVFGDNRFVLPMPVKPAGPEASDTVDFGVDANRSMIFDLNAMREVSPADPVYGALGDDDDYEDNDRTVMGEPPGFMPGTPAWGAQQPTDQLHLIDEDDEEDDATAVIDMDAVNALLAAVSDPLDDGDQPTAVFMKPDYKAAPPRGVTTSSRPKALKGLRPRLTTPEPERTPRPVAVRDAPPQPLAQAAPVRAATPRPAPVRVAKPQRAVPVPRAVATPRPAQLPAAAPRPAAPSFIPLSAPTFSALPPRRAFIRRLTSPMGIMISGLLVLLILVLVFWLPALLGGSDATAVIKITSEPVGASVTLDGKFQDKTTPAEVFDIKAGSTHELKLTFKSHASYAETIVVPLDIKSGHTIEVRAFLKKEPGLLKLTTDPPGADVYQDGRYVGVTPLEKADMPREKNEMLLRLHRDGYEIKKVVLTWGDSTVIEHREALTKKRR
jgi:serine/threonine protein kinase